MDCITGPSERSPPLDEPFLVRRITPSLLLLCWLLWLVGSTSPSRIPRRNFPPHLFPGASPFNKSYIVGSRIYFVFLSEVAQRKSDSGSRWACGSREGGVGTSSPWGRQRGRHLEMKKLSLILVTDIRGALLAVEHRKGLLSGAIGPIRWASSWPRWRCECPLHLWFSTSTSYIDKVHRSNHKSRRQSRSSDKSSSNE